MSIQGVHTLHGTNIIFHEPCIDGWDAMKSICRSRSKTKRSFSKTNSSNDDEQVLRRNFEEGVQGTSRHKNTFHVGSQAPYVSVGS